MIVLLLFVSAIVAMFTIQTTQREELLALDKQRPNKEMPAKRGNIYACDGKLMASTVPFYRIYMDTQTEFLKAKNGEFLKENIDSLAFCLSQKFGDRTTNEYKNLILNAYNKRVRRLSLYPKMISYADLKDVKTFPVFRRGRMRGGLLAEEQVQRIKPFGSLASRTIGDIYGQAEKGGRCGLELSFDSILRGTPGLMQYEHLGSYAAYVPIIEPEDGLDITTTIDIEIQDIAESVFMESLQKFYPEQGCVVVMEVATGEIKASVNMVRDADGNYSESDDMAFTMRPEPGSTFKTMSMMVALENGVVSIDDTIDTGDGVRKMYGRDMRDTHKNGKLTVKEVFAKSSNIGVSHIIDDYYKEKPGEFVDELYKMGVGKPMQLDIKNAVNPDVRHPKESGKRGWYKTTLPWMSIGYETGMPPIYVLAFYNAIANDGKYIKPFLVKSISKNGRNIETFKTETVNSKICSAHTLRDMRTMLRAVVTKGTAKRANSKFVTVAGKTGTAQIGYANRQNAIRHQITFCGYFPSEKPLYSMIVVMRKPIEPADAGTMCGPVARGIAERVYAQKVQNSLVKNDSIAEIPSVKSGKTSALTETLDKLDFDYTDHDSLWSSVAFAGEFQLAPIGVKTQKVPSVVGMAANDAVYLLEKAGLRVQMYGSGRVIRQSIEAGSVIQRGQTITLNLK